MVVIWRDLNGVVIARRELNLRPLHFNLVVRRMKLIGDGSDGASTFAAFHLERNGAIESASFIRCGFGVCGFAACNGLIGRPDASWKRQNYAIIIGGSLVGGLSTAGAVLSLLAAKYSAMQVTELVGRLGAAASTEDVYLWFHSMNNLQYVLSLHELKG